MSYRTPAERDGDAPSKAPPTRVFRLEKSWWQLGHTRLELDAEEEEIRATPVASFGSSQTLTWLVRKVERACTMLDDDAADALALVVDGEPKLLANGSKASCDAAVVEIDRFLPAGDPQRSRSRRARHPRRRPDRRVRPLPHDRSHSLGRSEQPQRAGRRASHGRSSRAVTGSASLACCQSRRAAA